MKYVLLFSLFYLWQTTELVGQDAIVQIKVNIKGRDKVQLSEIAEGLEAIPLGQTDLGSVLFITRISIGGGQIFILEHDEFALEPKSRLLQFDRSGKFIRQVGEKLLSASTTLMFDPTTESLLVNMRREKKIMRYDLNGNLLHTYDLFFESPYYYNKRYWGVIYSFVDKGVHYELKNSDLDGLNLKMTHSFTKTSDLKIYSPPLFSSDKTNLFVSFRLDNTLYKVSETGVTPAFHFKSSNEDVPLEDQYTRHVYKIGKYVFFKYYVGERSFMYVYSSENGTGKNISSNRRNRKQLSGIKDDIYGTGFVNLFINNETDGFCFIKQPDQVVGKVDGVKADGSPILFLGKMKN